MDKSPLVPLVLSCCIKQGLGKNGERGAGEATGILFALAVVGTDSRILWVKEKHNQPQTGRLNLDFSLLLLMFPAAA